MKPATRHGLSRRSEWGKYAALSKEFLSADARFVPVDGLMHCAGYGERAGQLKRRERHCFQTGGSGYWCYPSHFSLSSFRRSDRTRYRSRESQRQGLGQHRDRRLPQGRAGTARLEKGKFMTEAEAKAAGYKGTKRD
jgi:hypothetical protein